MSRLEWNEDKLERQIRFGVARGLTNVAKRAVEDVTAELPSVFDRPTPFTMRAIGSSWATKETLVSTVFVKREQLEYLGLEIEGGERRPEPGKPVNVPGQQASLNAYGNLPRRAIKRYIGQKNTFVADGKGKEAHLKPGVYRRSKAGARKAGGRGTKGSLNASTSSLTLLVGFKPEAVYAPRFDFVGIVERSVARNLERELDAAVGQALATAR